MVVSKEDKRQKRIAITQGEWDQLHNRMKCLEDGCRAHKKELARCQLLGRYTTVGGAASEEFELKGAIVGDLVQTSLESEGASPVSIKTAKITDVDTLTVVFSGDPADDHVFNYALCKPKA